MFLQTAFNRNEQQAMTEYCSVEKVVELAENEFRDIPVIFLTSKNDRESILKVMELKPEGYLLKTMEPERIVEEVDKFFMKQKVDNSFK